MSPSTREALTRPSQSFHVGLFTFSAPFPISDCFFFPLAASSERLVFALRFHLRAGTNASSFQTLKSVSSLVMIFCSRGNFAPRQGPPLPRAACRRSNVRFACGSLYRLEPPWPQRSAGPPSCRAKPGRAPCSAAVRRAARLVRPGDAALVARGSELRLIVCQVPLATLLMHLPSSGRTSEPACRIPKAVCRGGFEEAFDPT